MNTLIELRPSSYPIYIGNFLRYPVYVSYTLNDNVIKWVSVYYAVVFARCTITAIDSSNRLDRLESGARVVKRLAIVLSVPTSELFSIVHTAIPRPIRGIGARISGSSQTSCTYKTKKKTRIVRDAEPIVFDRSTADRLKKCNKGKKHYRNNHSDNVVRVDSFIRL